MQSAENYEQYFKIAGIPFQIGNNIYDKTTESFIDKILVWNLVSIIINFLK